MKDHAKVKTIAFAILTITVFLMVQSVSAVTPPYTYGGADQSKNGNAGVETTQITMSEGKFRMKGWAGAAGAVGYGLADSWGYFGIYATATQSRTIHAFTTVAYDGAIYMQAVLYWFGWARAGAWVRQIIRVYDTSDWHLVTSNTYWVYSQTVNSGIPFIPSTAERVFDGTRDKFGISVDFTATSGRTYAIEVFVEAQCACDGAGLAQSNSMCTFWGPTQGYPNIIGYVKVQEISWNYL